MNFIHSIFIFGLTGMKKTTFISQTYTTRKKKTKKNTRPTIYSIVKEGDPIKEKVAIKVTNSM